MTVRFLQIDAFSDRPFAGNPAAICLLDEPADPEWMQCLAMENNLSETAFVRKLDEGFELRWFTPNAEVDLCGHATLASAHALWSEGIVASAEAIRFHSRSGILTCTQNGPRIELDFPATPPTAAAADNELCEALCVQPIYVGRSKYDRLVVVDNEDIVRGLAPDFRRLAQTEDRGFIVTSTTANERFDFISRFFAPRFGVDEDPVTGSAHCCLAPYWAEVLGKTELTAYQASKRGGVVHLRLEGDRVLLGGEAVTVIRGEICEGP